MPKEAKPMLVPQAARQVGEAHGPWSWVEPSVWTERMLTALETGVKGGKWFSLIDKVYRTSNLQSAFHWVQANKGSAGVDNQTIIQFSQRLTENLGYASGSLRTQKYRPRAIKRVWIPKPGSKEKRPLGIPTVLDRVIQTTLRNVLEPIFERDFADHSYGFRPMRGCKDALRRVDGLLKSGYNWVVDASQGGGFDFLGYHFERGYKWPSDKSNNKLKHAIRAKTHRCNGHSLGTIIVKVNQMTKGWFEYFKHSYFTTFERHDSWIRMRLRSILRKRIHLKGRGRGADHQRWPNAYFAEHGLFSLIAAHEQLVNPRGGITTNWRAVCGRTARTVRREG